MICTTRPQPEWNGQSSQKQLFRCHSPMDGTSVKGVFGAGKTRSLAVLLRASAVSFMKPAVIDTKETSWRKPCNQVSDLSPTLKQFGRLHSRIEEGKGEAYASED